MAPPRRPEIVIGLDVGKSSHRACVVMRDGEVRRATRCHHEPHPGPSASPSSAHHATQAKPKIHSRPNQKRGAPAPADTPPPLLRGDYKTRRQANIALGARRKPHQRSVAERVHRQREASAPLVTILQALNLAPQTPSCKRYTSAAIFPLPGTANRLNGVYVWPI